MRIETVPNLKAIDDAKRNLKSMLHALKKPITKEVNDKKYWFFVVKHGQFFVLVGQNIDDEFMNVVFRLDFDKEALERLSKIKADKSLWLKFFWSLKSVISSPLTAYRINVDNDKNLTGFNIETTIFPFHDGFTMKELNGAIQAVVSVGGTGLDFISANLGALEIQQKLSDIPAPPAPEGMYR